MMTREEQETAVVNISDKIKHWDMTDIISLYQYVTNEMELIHEEAVRGISPAQQEEEMQRLSLIHQTARHKLSLATEALIEP